MNNPAEFPPLYLVTPEPVADKPLSHFIARLEHSLESGVRLVQLRAKTLAPMLYAKLAEEVLTCCRRYDARLLLNAPVDVVITLRADGIHLTSTRLMACASRPLPPGLWVSAACHDKFQVMHANRIGVDLLTISPVLPTATPTIAAPLGWPCFRELVKISMAPAYALGGMTADTLGDALASGACGIAAIRSLWGGAAE
jgi:thiamine-phosphate pyrophosphorylase